MRRAALERRTPLQTHTGLQRRTRLRPVSPRRRRELVQYRALREAFLSGHPVCQFPTGCAARAVDVHHRRGRFGARLLDVDWWAASCRFHNEFAETNTGEALRLGWLLRIEEVTQ